MPLQLVSVYRGADRDLWRVVWQSINREAILHARHVLSESNCRADSTRKMASEVKKIDMVKKVDIKKTYSWDHKASSYFPTKSLYAQVVVSAFFMEEVKAESDATMSEDTEDACAGDAWRTLLCPDGPKCCDAKCTYAHRLCDLRPPKET